MKNKNGFTLIELLAVIIILGVLMVIAVPAVTKYINDSRKNGYVSTAKSIAGGVRNLIHSGKLDLDDPNTTYYIDGSCIKTEGAYKSPYGDFDKAYVVVTADYDGYEYYWTSVDKTGIGVKSLISIDKLDSDNIEEEITSNDITTNRGLDGREHIVIVNSNCEKTSSPDAEVDINGLTGKRNVLCQRATTLHTSVCTNPSSGCHDGGYYSEGSKGTNIITYGNLGTNGNSLQVGDAFDCDVNGDGEYNSQNERFYYISSNGNTSSLIYYADISNNGTNITSPVQTGYAYATRANATSLGYECEEQYGCNNYGPLNAYKKLPSNEQWTNKKLILPGVRTIVNEKGVATTGSGSINIESFDYENKVARLLTYQDLLSIPGLNPVRIGSIDAYNFLLENVGMYETGEGNFGYWFETPKSDNGHSTYTFDGRTRNVVEVGSYSNHGIRPIITVKTSDIE